MAVGCLPISCTYLYSGADSNSTAALFGFTISLCICAHSSSSIFLWDIFGVVHIDAKSL